MQLPLISCICVTNGRVSMLARAIKCFKKQTYPNRELIVVTIPEDVDTQDFVQTQHVNNMYVLHADNAMTLGALRNYGTTHSHGKYICQWDDDDWYHPDRLSYQYEWLANYKCAGSVLTNCILFDSTSSKAYVSGMRPWEGSILCDKTVMQQFPYKDLQKAEDTYTVANLFALRLIKPISRKPELYIYNYHGSNSYSDSHYRAFFKSGKPLSAGISAIISDVLTGKLKDDLANNLKKEILISE